MLMMSRKKKTDDAYGLLYILFICKQVKKKHRYLFCLVASSELADAAEWVA